MMMNTAMINTIGQECVSVIITKLMFNIHSYDGYNWSGKGSISHRKISPRQIISSERSD